MKAKLSFLALSLCLSLVLTFVLAACGSDSPTRSEGTSSNSHTSMPSSENQILDELEIWDFGTDATTSKGTVFLLGTVKGTKDLPVENVTLIINPYGDKDVLYNRDLLHGVEVSLRQYAKIDLKDMPCGSYEIAVKACNSKRCANTETKTFEKICATSSAGGGGASSSSVAVWKFGLSTAVPVPKNTDIPIGGNGQFQLIAIDEEDDGQPDVSITNGKIRPATANCIDDDVEQDKAYSSEESCLGSKPATVSKLSDCAIGGFIICAAQQWQYFIIYLDDGSKYLIQFDKSGSGKFDAWPKKATYWRASESP